MARNITEFFQENSGSKEEASIFQAAVADTEKEVLADGGQFPDQDPYDQDGDGDTELEQPEDPLDIDPALDQQEIEASEDDGGESEELEADEAEGEEEPQRNERNERFVPSYRLREESERRERLERELAELRGQVNAIQRPQQQPQQQPQKPDPFADPEGHERWVVDNAIRQVQERNFNAAMADGLEEHGEEFRFAHDELAKLGPNNPEGIQVFQRMMAARDPVKVLMRWAEPRLQEYRENRDQELLERMSERYGIPPEELNRRLAIPREGNRPQQPQRQMGRIPPSLNSAGGSGRTAARDRVDPRGMDGSEAAIFADAFTPLR